MIVFPDQTTVQNSSVVLAVIFGTLTLEISFFSGLFPVGYTPFISLIFLIAFSRHWSAVRLSVIWLMYGAMLDILLVGELGIYSFVATLIGMVLFAFRQLKLLPESFVGVLLTGYMLIMLMIVFSSFWFDSFALADVLAQIVIRIFVYTLSVLFIFPFVQILLSRRSYESLS